MSSVSVTVTETGFKPGDERYYHIEGYNLFSASRVRKRGGGVAIYANVLFNSTRISAVQQDHSVLHIKASIANKNYQVVNIDNPHTSVANQMLQDFEYVLASTSGPFILTADFNRDLLSVSTLRDYYVDLLQYYGLLLINSKVPTRGSCFLDHIWSNETNIRNFNFFPYR